MTEDRKRDFFDAVQPKLTQFTISLQEQDGLTVAEVGDALMSAAVAISVGATGRAATAAALLGIARGGHGRSLRWRRRGRELAVELTGFHQARRPG